jgi:hypothetical protein
VKFSVGSQTITVYGEAYGPGFGNPNFVAYVKSLKHWDNGTSVRPDELDLIKKTLEKDFLDNGWHLEWE